MSSRLESVAISPVHSPARAPSLFPLLVMLSGTFMVVLDFFIVNVALPSMQLELGATDSAMQFVAAGYGLATTAGLITGGRLGDIFGQRRLFGVGLLLFTTASATCGLAPNAATLVGARVAQGLAGAVLQPQVLAMLGRVYAGPGRAGAFAGYGMTLGLGAILGQLVGGLLIEANFGGLGWRNCFLINIPIGLVALAVVNRAIPPLEPTGRSRLDLTGMLLIAAAVLSVFIPLVEGRQQGWPMWSGIVLLASLPLLGVFLWHQFWLDRRGGQPLVAPALLRLKRLRMGLFVTIVFYVGNASFYFVLALFLQQTMALDAMTSGLVFTVLAVGFTLTSFAGRRIHNLLGARSIAIGAAALAVGHALLIAVVLLAPAEQTVRWMLPVLFLEGAGIGVVMAPLVSVILAGLPPEHAGVAAGVLATVQQMGNSVGIALIGILYFAASATRANAIGTFASAMIYLLGVALLTAALYIRMLRVGSSESSRAPPM